MAFNIQFPEELAPVEVLFLAFKSSVSREQAPSGVFIAGGSGALVRRWWRCCLGWRKEKASWDSVGPVGRNLSGLAQQGRRRWAASTWAELKEGIRNWFFQIFAAEMGGSKWKFECMFFNFLRG
jgi:hypothetical protein